MASPEEEYALYNFLFLCREAFAEGINRKDWSPPRDVLEFVSKCLRGEYLTEELDLVAAAGVGFAEHLFDDASTKNFGRVHAAVGQEFYGLCRPWLEKWLEPDEFAAVDRAGS